jgi:hypothetical protein
MYGVEMKLEITRRNGDIHTVLFDDEDAELVLAHKWHIMVCRRTHYAGTSTMRSEGVRGVWPMHRLLLGFPRGFVDHANGNGLDNRRVNIRVATARQNSRNQRVRLQPSKSSQYKGVHWIADHQKWRAMIWDGGPPARGRYLGVFEDEIEAAIAYDRAAVESFGNFARPNFPASRPSNEVNPV